MKLLNKINIKWQEIMRDREDLPVLDFLKDKLENKNLNFLEVGPGLGRFLSKLKDSARFKITAIEINNNLCEKVRLSGFDCINDNILKNNFDDKIFDIIHCSHIIEHFSYPEIKILLNELIRITKINGFLIFRSPLSNPAFYFDIDHFRPYPPESILNFINSEQQQTISDYSVNEIKRWYRRWPVIILTDNRLSRYFNCLMALLWIHFSFPFSRRNGYVLILQRMK
jgi:ubiquinone/menaquinone biosynthesis C-methylase UbiE